MDVFSSMQFNKCTTDVASVKFKIRVPTEIWIASLFGQGLY
jgi:hypothetical protein